MGAGKTTGVEVGMTYTTGLVRGYLCNYQERAMHARPPQRDVLAVRVPPLEEAPYAASSCIWSDIEIAMRNLPFNWQAITFAVLCLGGGKDGTSWRNGMSVYNWREKVGDFWELTAGDVNRIVKDAIQEMTDSLNGVAFDVSRS
ncbi:hypothetical protein LCGC14_1810980 [marine sediment metagenome]|uniref:Uncharacterized protein n=1 Tax=marine sediment metagenome TaxID=412755 RepID=A0A0F9JLI4_9ZZZZ